MRWNRGPTAGFLLDALIVGAAGVSLAGVYLARLERRGAKLRMALEAARDDVLPKVSDLVDGLFTISYFAWPDMSQNVFDSFVLVHGGSVYRDAVTNHMPGVAQLVGLVMSVFGFAEAFPGTNTLDAGYLAGSVATVLFQLACAFVALRLLRFSRTAAVVLSLIPCAYTAFAYDFALPMSETLIAHLFVLVPVLAFNMLFGAHVHDRVVYALMLGGPFTVLCLNLGLTAAPANALLLLAALAVGLREHGRDPKAVRDALLHDRRSWLAYLVVAVIILLSAATVHIRDAWFWLADVNRVFVVDPLDAITHSFATHVSDMFGRVDPIGSRYPHLLVALSLLAVAVLGSPHSTGRAGESRPLLVFIILICSAAVLTQWRMNSGVKSVTLFGLTLGTAYLALHLYLRDRRPASDLWLLPLFAAPVLLAGVLVKIVQYDRMAGPRHAALDAANVCRFGETRDCRCIQVTLYVPQLFLLNDMRSCSSRFASSAFVVDRHPMLRRMMTDDVKRADMAFWTYSPELMRESGVPDEAIRYLQTQATCFPVTGREAICTAPP